MVESLVPRLKDCGEVVALVFADTGEGFMPDGIGLKAKAVL
jgi:hypothetical protein